MAKRGLNIYKRKDGRWEARYIKCRTAQGKAKYGYLYAASYHEVRHKLQQTVHGLEMDREPTPHPESVLFEKAVEKWLTASSGSFKESTYIRYRFLARNYLLPEFQMQLVSEITQEKVRNFCRKLECRGKKDGTGLAAKTTTDILSVLKRILCHAQERGISIDASILGIRIKQNQKPPEILSLSEQKLLQRYLMEHPDPINLGILLCLFTGIRIGELCALTWENISLEDKTIHICQTMQRIQMRTAVGSKTHIIITSPKSSAADRTIPLSSAMLSLLNCYSQQRTGYFLSGSPTAVIEPRRVQHRFHKVLASCGMSRKNFHILRHTFATRCIETGIDIKTLSEILGHSSVNITMNRYVHPTLKLKRDSMERLADFIAVK